jgi:hypothetical protein
VGKIDRAGLSFTAWPADHLRRDEPPQAGLAAGAEILEGPVDREYDSRDFIARDPEGNLWSFGTYPGQPRR